MSYHKHEKFPFKSFIQNPISNTTGPEVYYGQKTEIGFDNIYKVISDPAVKEILDISPGNIAIIGESILLRIGVKHSESLCLTSEKTKIPYVEHYTFIGPFYKILDYFYHKYGSKCRILCNKCDGLIYEIIIEDLKFTYLFTYMASFPLNFNMSWCRAEEMYATSAGLFLTDAAIYDIENNNLTVCASNNWNQIQCKTFQLRFTDLSLCNGLLTMDKSDPAELSFDDRLKKCETGFYHKPDFTFENRNQFIESLAQGKVHNVLNSRAVFYVQSAEIEKVGQEVASKDDLAAINKRLDKLAENVMQLSQIVSDLSKRR